LYPVRRYLEAGAGSSFSAGKKTIFLGAQCDTFSEHLGAGQWCWANGGFRAGFADRELGFPRQEVYCPSDDKLSSNCQCP
jgi:hypothetical protein